MKSKILIIEDDQQCLHSYRRIFSDVEREIEYFERPDEALEVFEKNPFAYSIAFIDHQYKHDDKVIKLGAKVAHQLKKINPMMTICIVSGDETSESLTSWLLASVDNYIYKPFRKAEAMILTEHYVTQYEKNFIPMNIDNFKSQDSEIMEKMGIIGSSNSILECAEDALRFSKNDVNVLLLGETGTGKELFANGIHKNSSAKQLSIYPVNCANYKDNSQLLEVELFGSEKGAFTGAERKAGIFEVAQGGTVFLDEIQHLNMSAQAKLLRVLQEKKIRRVGGDKEYSIQFRIIAAGKPDLEELCKNGLFSVDLYYRLKILDIVIPPLRERKKDIRPLTGFFLSKIKEKTGKSKQISIRAMEHLEKYDWPGNVRELEQLIEKLNVIVDEDIIYPKHLPKEIMSAKTLNEASVSLPDLDDKYRKKKIDLILNTLTNTNYNFTETTRRLGLGDKRSTLRRIMKQLKINDLSESCKDKMQKTGFLNLLNSNILKGGKHENN